MNFKKKIIVKENQDTLFEAVAKDLGELDEHLKRLRKKLW